jgi:hypothetical protein
MDKIAKDFIKNGKDVNELMNMPFHYVLEILQEKVESKKVTSLISAFGG